MPEYRIRETDLAAGGPGRLKTAWAPGFSMMELMAVIVVMAIMALMAVPATIALVPRAQLRAEAQNASSIMRQARLKAANTQRPTRVVFDCGPHTADKSASCLISMQAASFEDGAFKDWQNVTVSGDLLNGYRMRPNVLATNAGGDDLMWVIFMPSSRVYTSEVKNFDSTSAPYEMVFLSENFARNRNMAAWYLTVNSSTGRTALRSRR